MTPSRQNRCCYTWIQSIFQSIMTVTIPSERLGTVKLAERDALADIAIGLYKREEISLGRAAEIAGLSTVEFMSELARRHIPMNYDVPDLRSDLTTLKKLS
jgi:predicted HTH domain antitoxin